MKAGNFTAAALVLLYAMGGLAADKPAAPAFGLGGGAPKAGGVPGGAGGAKPDERVPFTVYGTWNALQAATNLIAQHENGRKLHGIRFMPYDSDRIIGMLDRHECDVGLLLDSFVPAANQNSLGRYERFPVGRFVIAVAVNSRNPLRAMSMSDLVKAFAFNPVLAAPPWDGTSGRHVQEPPRPNTKNLTKSSSSWKYISGARSDKLIEMYRPEKFGPEGWFFQKRVLLGGPFADEFSSECIALHEKKSDAEIIAAVGKDANAIGFFQCPFDKTDGKQIRIVGVAKDGGGPPVVPSPATLADGNGDYPLADTLSLYLRPDAPAEAREFCKFAVGPDAAKTIKECGFWPEFELGRLRVEQRLAEAKAGKGPAISLVGPADGEALVNGLALKYVEAKAAVQVHYRTKQSAPDAARVLLDGKAELLLLDGAPETALPEELIAGLDKKCKRVVLGQAALGVVVHPKTLLKSLSVDELRQVFCGKIKNWPSAGKGGGPAIHGYGLRSDSAVMEIYRKGLGARGEGLGRGNGGKILAGAAGSGAPEEKPLAGAAGSHPLTLTTEADTSKVVLAVARDPDGIGLVDLSQMPKDDKSVTLLAIDLGKGRGEANGTSVQPAAGDVPEGYPLVQPCVLYVSPTAGDAAKNFFTWLASPGTNADRGNDGGANNDRVELLARFGLLPGRKALVAGDEGRVQPAGEVVATLGKEPQVDLEAPRAAGSDSAGAEGDALDVPQRRNITAKNAKDAKKKTTAGAKAPAGNRTAAPPGKVAGSSADDAAEPFDAVMMLLGFAAVGGIVSVVAVGRVKRRKSSATRQTTSRQSRVTGFGGDYDPLDDLAGSTGRDGGTQGAGRTERHGGRSLQIDLATGVEDTMQVDKAFDPYHVWLSIPPDEQPPNHYRLLGLAAFENDREVIEEAADRQMAHLRTFQLGQFAALSQELLGEVSVAKGCLLSPAKKPVYDAHLRRRLAEASV